MEEIAAEFINGILSSDQQGNSLISGQSSQDVDLKNTKKALIFI